jgi:sialic acid synthase
VKMSKKLVATRALPAGHVLAREDICAKSPGDGLPPYEVHRLVGRALRQPVEAESALTFEMLEPESVGSTAYGAMDAV